MVGGRKTIACKASPGYREEREIEDFKIGLGGPQ